MAKSLVTDALRSTDSELIEQLRDAIANLDWTSEADYPLELKVWDSQVSEPLTTEDLLGLIKAPPESTITEEDFAAFLSQPPNVKIGMEMRTLRSLSSTSNS